MRRLSDRDIQGGPRGDSWHATGTTPPAPAPAPAPAQPQPQPQLTISTHTIPLAARINTIDHAASPARFHDSPAAHSSGLGLSPGPGPGPGPGPRPANHRQPAHSAGAALAARITFPLPPTTTRVNESPPPRRSRRHSDPPPHLRPPLSPDRELLGPPHTSLSTSELIAQYQPQTTFCTQVQSYLASEHKAVFDWWWHRVVDRLDRKLPNGIALDSHEVVIYALNEANRTGKCEFAAVLNYFAEQVVPVGGFTKDQIQRARNDPQRWDRRNKREKEWHTIDPSGEVGEKWHSEQIARAQAHWARYQEAVRKYEEKEKLRRQQDKLLNKSEGTLRGRKVASHTRSNTEILSARFDAKNRIGKGGRPPTARWGRNMKPRRGQ